MAALTQVANPLAFSSSKTEKKSVAVISDGCHLKGNVEISGPLYINGFIRGHVVSSASVFIGASASVTGDIKAKTVLVNGRCAGTIYADNIEILDQGNVLGAIYAKSCAISRGGSIEGKVKLGYDYR